MIQPEADLSLRTLTKGEEKYKKKGIFFSRENRSSREQLMNGMICCQIFEKKKKKNLSWLGCVLELR